MRIHWHSNAPWAPTGYGNQTKLFLPRLARLGHYISMTAFWGLQGGMIRYAIDDLSFNVHANGRHPYGIDVMVPNAVVEKADICITLIDAFVVEPMRFAGAPVKWVPWFPVDSVPMKRRDYEFTSQAYRRIVYSRFAEEELRNHDLDCYYVPHGVDTKVFRPVDRQKAREFVSFPQDRFVVGMVAANKGWPPRKAFAEQITAFAAFRKMHPEAMLYFHTDDGTHGGEVFNLLEFLRINKLKYAYSVPGQPPDEDVAVMFCDQYTYATTGFGDEYMNAAYNGMDVHMLVSSGEGFGIPLIEAQAAGCPVLIGDWTAMSDLCFSGWKVSKDTARPFWNAAGVFQYYANPVTIFEQLEEAYRVRGNEEYRKRARKGALAFDADKVTERYWKPVLEEIEDSLQERVEVEVLETANVR